MNVLLDTNVILWAARTPERLGAAQAVIVQAERRFLSAVCVWEMAIKQRLGKLALGADVRSWQAQFARQLALEPLDVTADHAAEVEHLPDVHRDPFDRLLVAQARVEGAILLTADQELRAYGTFVQLVD